MATSSKTFEKECAEFEAKVKRTVFVDNLSPQVTKKVIETAFSQFGTVLSIELIANHIKNFPMCCLVEMENPNQAGSVIEDIRNLPFMICGMPRPIRVQKAKAEMFGDRPCVPDKKIPFQWIGPNDADFEVAQEMKRLVKRQAAEVSLLLKVQMVEEQKLAEKHDEMLKSNYQKYQMTVAIDGSLRRLARHYKINLSD
ncbi:hypothetical protein QJS04_geneDACA004414 [Acorus gramineus]|uniref:RRM domain-containing protein n=1 Tax=Acorus gramineus TaxID=55184 RepID=A0AAV9B3Y3_ACOGR|nr:hypothetical protein QJS04_geneDACA004414 [Acorus gramineus]